MTEATDKAHHHPEWAVAVFGSREDSRTLVRCADRVQRACTGRRTTLDLLINGNPALSEELAAQLSPKYSGLSDNVELRVWDIALPDKAETWNQYLYSIWPVGAVSTFFVDGYVQVEPEALSNLATYLIDHPSSMCASGVPGTGRSAKKYQRQVEAQGWGLHGNLYALPLSVVQKLRGHSFRIPMGMYRTDPYLGAALAFSLDPSSNDWEPEKCLKIVPGVHWSTPARSMFRYSDLRDQWRRRKRQAIGLLENAAIKQMLARDKRSPNTLPRSIQEILESWSEAHPEQVRQLCSFRPGLIRTLTKATAPRDWQLAEIAPRLTYSNTPQR